MRRRCCLVITVLALTPAPSSAQAVVSFQQQITSGWSQSASSTNGIARRTALGVAGTNVQPIGGASGFTLRSEWELQKQDEQFSLRITDINPDIRLDESSSRADAVYVQRSSSLYVAPTGALGALRPSPLFIPAETLSVFTGP